MTEKKTAKITGFNISGEERVYEFDLMTAWDNLGVFHEYASLGLTALPDIAQIIERVGDLVEDSESTSDAIEKIGESAKNGDDVIGTISQLLPKLLPFSRLQKLAGLMLSNATVSADGEKHETDETGMCDMFAANPTELYVALFWAASVNYPKQFDPFLEALTVEEGEGSTPDSEVETAVDAEINAEPVAV